MIEIVKTRGDNFKMLDDACILMHNIFENLMEEGEKSKAYKAVKIHKSIVELMEEIHEKGKK